MKAGIFKINTSGIYPLFLKTSRPKLQFDPNTTNPCSTMTSWAADYGLKSCILGEHMEIKSTLS